MLRTLAQLVSPGGKEESATDEPLKDGPVAGAAPVSPDNQLFTDFFFRFSQAHMSNVTKKSRKNRHI